MTYDPLYYEDEFRCFLGSGTYGRVYDLDTHVLKVTRHPAEYRAALKLIKSPQPWASPIMSAKRVPSGEFFIIKEKIVPFISGEHKYPHPGHFHGIIHQLGRFKGRATRPVEFNGQGFNYNNGLPLKVAAFDTYDMTFLASLYEHPVRKNCLTWFLTNYFKVQEQGYFTADLWCNIGVNKNNEFVFFDLMLQDAL